MAEYPVFSPEEEVCAALAKSEVRYRLLVEAFPEAMVVLGPDCRVLLANQRAAVLLGYADSAALNGLNFLKRVLPEERAVLKKALAARVAFNGLNISLSDQSGQVIPVELSGADLNLPGGEDEQALFVRDRRPILAAEAEALRIQQALSLSEERLQMVISSAPVLLAALDSSGRVQLFQTNRIHLTSLAGKKVLGASAFELFSHLPEVLHCIRRALNGETFKVIFEGLSSSILDTWFTPQRGVNGDVLGVSVVGVDISERVRAEQALRESEKRYRTVVEYQTEGVVILNESYQIDYANLAAEGILGASHAELVGSSMWKFIAPEKQIFFRQQVEARRQGKTGSYEITIQRSDGQKRLVWFNAVPRFDPQGQFSGSFAVFRDITDRRRAEERLYYQALHDPLTGLYNRLFFEEEVNRLEKERLTPVGVISVDLDGLKQVNDHQGHAAGDQLIRQAADLLRRSFRVEDVIARIGGDEFAILLPESETPALRRALERLRAIVADHNRQEKGGQTVQISAGGATAYPGQSILETLMLADQRMYHEKRSKKSRLFSPGENI
jgi:diguanylate cyclase (GGDEF)-like protein/PAS domain S-box-containing protein